MNLDPRLFRLARQGGISLAIAILLGFAAGVLTVWQAWTLSAVIGGAFLHRQALPQLTRPLTLLLALMLLRALISWGSEIGAASLARRVKTSLRLQLAAHLLSLGPIGIGQERTGELSLAVSRGIETLDAYFSQYLPQLALSALVPLAFLLFVFPIDPLTGFVLLLTAPLLPIFMILVGSLAQSATRRQWRILRRLNAYFLDVLQGLSTLKMLGRSRQQGAVLESAGERYRQATMSVLRVAFLSALTLEMVATLSTAVVAVEVGLRLLYFRLTFEQAFLVLLLAPEFYLPLRLLGARFHAGMSGVAAAEQIFSILEQPPLSESPIPEPEQPVVERRNPSAIRFREVHLTYPDGRRALNGVSFEIAPGKITALVGPSGAGKSSIASLLLRFIRPTAGEILVNQVPLSDIPLQTWRRQVAYVPHSPYLFNESLAANVRLGAPTATQEEVAQACRLAGAEAFIQELPLGYETPLGERGRRLSGGQAQRIALARAFLQDAPLLILDEPAASLDPALESELNVTLERLAAGRTVLIIAHRLSTARRADHIIILDAGQVVQQGTHAELAQADGLYRRLLQACPATAMNQAARTAESLPSSPQTEQWLPLTRADEASSTAAQSVQDEHPISSAKPSHGKRSTKPFWRLVSLAASIRGWIALSVLAGAATIASGIGLMSASAYIISAAALHPSIADLQVAIVGVRFFGLARGISRYLERLVSHQAAFRLLARLRVWLYNALEPLAPARLLRYRAGDLLTRMIEDIESLENFYVRALAPPLVGLAVALGMTVFFWQFDTSLALTLLGFHLLTGAGVPLLARLTSRRYGRRLVAARAALNAFLTDMVQGMPDLLAANQREQRLAHLSQLDAALARIQQQMACLGAMQNSVITLLANLGLWTVLILAIPLVAGGTIAGVHLGVLALAALASFEALAPLPAAAQHLETDLQAFSRLMEITDAAPEVSDPHHAISIPQLQPPTRVRALHAARRPVLLEVRDLSFFYPPALDEPAHPSPALSGIRFRLDIGQSLAVVGASGAGKSSLASLLLRFWEYSRGQILLLGNDLRQYNQEEVRRLISLVPQHPYLFHATVRDNLLIARPDASEAEIRRAVKAAQIEELIRSLPQGYDTWVGEQGVRLSGGERQRIAIARALLKDAPLLILDEATANLDALTEYHVLEALQEYGRDRAVLHLTHRLVGLENMQEIIVLQQGRIVERGQHAELIAADGWYSRMWRLQRQNLSDLFSVL